MVGKVRTNPRPSSAHSASSCAYHTTPNCLSGSTSPELSWLIRGCFLAGQMRRAHVTNDLGFVGLTRAPSLNPNSKPKPKPRSPQPHTPTLLASPTRQSNSVSIVQEQYSKVSMVMKLEALHFQIQCYHTRHSAHHGTNSSYNHHDLYHPPPPSTTSI